jgi:hypothetical protein
MMHVVFKRNTITSQGKARIGDALDLPDFEAKSLINYGRCVQADAVRADAVETAPAQSINVDELHNTSLDTDELQNTSIGLESSDAEPVIRRGRPKKAK